MYPVEPRIRSTIRGIWQEGGMDARTALPRFDSSARNREGMDRRAIAQDKPLHSEGRKMVRLKFVVSEKTTRLHWDKSKGTIGTCKLLPVSGGSEENKAFYEATPSGSVEFGTINQAALDTLPLGADVYISIEVANG